MCPLKDDCKLFKKSLSRMESDGATIPIRGLPINIGSRVPCCKAGWNVLPLFLWKIYASEWMVDVSKCLRLIWRICTWKGKKKRLPSSNLQRAGGFRQGSGPVVEISNFGLFETYEILTMNLLIQFPKRRSRSFPKTRMAGFVILRNFFPEKTIASKLDGYATDFSWSGRTEALTWYRNQKCFDRLTWYRNH